MPNFRLLLLSLCVLSASSYAGSQMRLTGGITSTSISTKEWKQRTITTQTNNGSEVITTSRTERYLLNEESGSLLGGGVGFEWLSDSGVYYGGTLDVGDGDVTYKGLSQLGAPINNGTSYFYFWRPKVYAGKQIDEWMFKPRIEVEVGGQLKERHINPRTEGIDGYKETYTWWFAGAGVSLEILGDEDWSWRTGLNYRTMIQPTNDAEFANRDIPLGSTDSIGWLNSVYLNLGEDLYLGLELDITKASIEKSREIYDGVITTDDSSLPNWVSQPESEWTEVNLRIAMSKRFDF